MRRATRMAVWIAVLMAASFAGLRAAGQETAAQEVPRNLKPLLAPRPSEMRFVTVRYEADRATLNGNYTVGVPRAPRGGRGGAADPAAAKQPEPQPPIIMSKARIQRLLRFDLDWQDALARLDAAKLTAAGRADLEALRKAIAANIKGLEDDAAKIAALSPVLPFADDIVNLSEARTRLEDIDSQKAAGIVTEIAKKASAVHTSVEAGLGDSGGAGALRVSRETALDAVRALDALNGVFDEWFNFYNGYDPLFTWWMGMPYEHAKKALGAYRTLLADKVAPAATTGSPVPPSTASRIEPAPAPRYPSVPDLEELMGLGYDEMAPVVERFRGSDARRTQGMAGTGERVAPGGSRGAAGGATRDPAYYRAWLKALRTLDFKSLSRNAQVDYLFIRTTAEQQIARAGIELPANPPRKNDDSGIEGPARGRQGLIFDLQDVFIPYTPEELIEIANKEFAWCEEEMRKASRQMGFGDDWKKAIEHVKQMHPPPGGQVAVVRDLMFGAVDFLRERDLLTIPSVAAESLRMVMMTPERQLVNPFFTGGSVISVSYPTNTMEYEARVQSMRGNNTPFSHATAFHEVIPGHNMVWYMNARYSGYRADLGGTSFWGEGWPLYWEMMMYDNGYHATPEDKVGALFWRMHRCARIIFSLRFHMGEWSPAECIDFLVDRVGHERDNATAEVRRSFQGSYPPLYQAAYLLGGLQLRALRRELVDTGLMPEKSFHDEILRQGSMPIALLRLAIGKMPLTPDTSLDWRFYDN